MNKKEYSVVIVGASGAVGSEMLRVLEEKAFPISELRLVASEKSVGQECEFRGKRHAYRKLIPSVFEGMDLAFFTSGTEISRDYVPIAADMGTLVVDNSSAFRMDPKVPLIIPEVNGHLLQSRPEKGIVAVPNCAAIQMLVALAPLHRARKIRRIVVSTYQSTSGAGKEAMEELSMQVRNLFNYQDVVPKVFPHQIAFNVLPHIDTFYEDGSTGEERKIIQETKKILEDLTIGVSATAVRVPTFHGHAESINIETEDPLLPEDARNILMQSEGVVVMDDPKESLYPTPAPFAGEDEVFVGRIRKDESRPNCLNLWVVSDNLRKGAALNGYQIMQLLIQNKIV